MKVRKKTIFAVFLGFVLLSLALSIKWQTDSEVRKRITTVLSYASFYKRTKLRETKQSKLKPLPDILQRRVDGETSDEFMERMKLRMEIRRERIKYVCDKFELRQKNTEKIQRMIVEKYKLVYCSIPKTGCSNLKRVMLVLNGFGNKSEDVFPRHIKGQNPLLHEEVNANFSVTSFRIPKIVTEQNFTKFIVVRHPFERALSAYNDKLVNEKSGKAKFHETAQQIRKKYGSSETKQAEGHDPTFEEFVSFLLAANNTKRTKEDRHWNSYDVICQPCKNDYDVIAKLETIDEDFRYLMILIGAPDRLTMPGGYAEGGRSKTNKEMIAKFFGSLPKNKIDDLYEVYKVDFLSYGYTIEDVLPRRIR